MPRHHIVVESDVFDSLRVAKVRALFDVPLQERSKLTWDVELPIEDKPWNIGLIVGPSGCGKTTILREAFGDPRSFDWPRDKSVIDGFRDDITLDEISGLCTAVGFNTIPAWLRPFGVLSNGEQFRVSIARTLSETEPDEVCLIDEFTSVVDRQVAKIASHAVQKFIRRSDRRLVVASCHYDIIDWLQPDWVYRPAEANFEWRDLQPRPEIDVSVCRVEHKFWRLFAPFHYLTNKLHKAATCYVLFVDGTPAVFCGVLYRPRSTGKNKADIWGLSRVVTLPDWQGMGLAFVAMDVVGSAYMGIGCRFHTYPAARGLIKSFAKSPTWKLQKKAGSQAQSGRTTTLGSYIPGTRPCATYRYCGSPMDSTKAEAFIRSRPMRFT